MFWGGGREGEDLSKVPKPEKSQGWRWMERFRWKGAVAKLVKSHVQSEDL